MERKFKIEVPVLLIGFNRPDIIKQSLENIRQYHPQKLYITIDGPREGNQDDLCNVSEVRRIVEEIDFCKNIKYKINEENKGCEVTVSSGIAWVLEKEEYVIVLEDDVIVHESFFRFVQEMLELYKNDDRIAMVSGCNYTPMKFPNDEDYCFCQSGHISGWATWRRVWKDYNLHEVVKADYLSLDYLRTVSPNREIAKARLKEFKWIKSRGKDINWDFMFGYFRITRKMLSIVPRSHLTSNVGVFGLHGNGLTKAHFLPIDDNFIVRKHPKEVIWNKQYDIYHFNKWIKTPFYKRFLLRIKRILHKLFN